jgi:hypothetical protein
MNTKVLMIAGGGLLAGIGVAAALYMFVLGGGGDGEALALSTEPTPEPTPVVVEGKLGPHIVLEDRVYTLRSPAEDPRYVRLQIVIEFETFAEEWEHVLHGCVFVAEEGDVSPCKALENELLHEFEEEIGTGKALIEDAITSVVSAKSYEDLATFEGREELRAEILHSVGELIHEPKVTRVLFLEFLTQ